MPLFLKNNSNFVSLLSFSALGFLRAFAVVKEIVINSLLLFCACWQWVRESVGGSSFLGWSLRPRFVYRDVKQVSENTVYM